MSDNKAKVDHKKIALSTKLGCGAFAGIVGTSLIYPLDFTKTRIQNSNSSGGAIISEIYKNHGIKGFYRGLLANLIGISPEKAIKLAVNDYIREMYATNLNINEADLPLKYGVVAGATAGVCQVIVTNPMEMTKIQMQMGSNSTLQVVKTLGISGLYKSSLATLSRDVPFSFIFFPSLALLKSVGPKGEDGSPTFGTVFSSGILAGAVAAALVTPMDVVKTRLQTGSEKHAGIFSCARYSDNSKNRSIYTTHGIRGLFKGVLPRIMIVSPLFAITVLVYEFQQKYLSS